MTLSEHAIRRAKERLGWGHKALERMAYKALREGNALKDLDNDELRRYVESRARSPGEVKAILCSNVTFLFGGRPPTLITVYPPNKKLVKPIKRRQPNDEEE